MNSHQRRTSRRLAHALDEAGATIVKLRAELAAAEDSRDALALAAAEMVGALDEAAGELHSLGIEVYWLSVVRDERGKEIDQLKAEVVRLRDEDHDPAKLRRRLADRGRELEAAHARIRQLEAEARDAARVADSLRPIVFARSGR